VLGNAGVQFWGKSGDTETTRYASELSGVVRVQFRAYEHHGGERAWKQFWSATGAPYRLEDRGRAGIMPEHVHGLPKGWWYVYSGEPTDIELCVPAPMFGWEEKVLPGQAESARMLAVPKRRQETDLAQPAADAGPPQETSPDAPPSDEAVTSSNAEPDRARNGRPCPGCGRPVSAAVRFCGDCGCRL
jgi:hypothetical protein